MDKLKAYKLLTERLEFFSHRENIDAFFTNGCFEERATVDAVTYSIIYREKLGKIAAQVHDNNSQNFKLLEESIDIVGKG